MAPRKALLIINKKSREGQGDLRQTLEFLRSHGITFVQPGEESPSRFGDLIRRHRDEVDLVVVGGGDGTLRCVAEALLETGLPMGILPLGTANDLARTLQIPTEPMEAAEVIANGRLHQIDLGSVNGHYFFNVAHLGLGVHVTRHLSKELKRRWGVWCYLRAVVKAVRDRRPFIAALRCDQQFQNVLSIHIAVGNGRHYGGGMTVADKAAIDDHLLYVYSIQPVSFWKLLTLTPSLRQGLKQSGPGVLLLRGRTIEIHTKKPMPVEADGEKVTETPAKFEVVPEAVSVFVPEEYLRVGPDHAYESGSSGVYSE